MVPTSKTYEWEKTKDGRYNIKKIEIFSAIKDNKSLIEKEDVAKILKNFKEDKDKDWLPRVHVGHQDYKSSENQPGIGFIDNLVEENGVFFADIIDVGDKEFGSIVCRQYPYRSVEYDTKEKKIFGLAMLESKPPYFSFPLLSLKQYSKKENIVYFSMEEMEDKEEKNVGEEKGKGDEVEVPSISSLTEDEMGRIRILIAISDELVGLARMSRELSSLVLDGGKTRKPVVPSESENSSPTVVGFQKKGENMDKYEELLSKISDRLDTFEKNYNSVGAYKRLQDVCDNSSFLQFELEKAFVDKLSSEKDKTLYIEKLEAGKNSYK